ncbi:MAG TPA: hypothetical protein VJR70_02345 [Stellaceae bacterium]|nr:hypothetical protein [Stellaceae bacterium]
MPAEDLVRLVAQLGAPYGMEKSVKIVPGAVLADRCLLSIHRAGLGPAPLDRLIRIGRELEIPAEFADELPRAFDDAEFVHFGHEAGPGFELRKIYFEYAGAARRAIATANGGSVLVHLAYKWPVRGPGGGSVTRYSWVHCRTRHAVEARLRVLLPAAEAPRALRCALGLLDRVAALAEAGRLLMMLVEEPGNPRQSCDLNVYDAGLCLAQVCDVIDAALDDFAVPPSQGTPVFGGAGSVALGHLSAGIGRDGAEFVTFYYGVEAH